MRPLFLILLGFTCSLTAGEIAVDVSIDNKVIATVPATYCSFNIDGVSLHDSFNWSDPNFFKVTKVWTASGPTHLRIGGTFGDYVAYGDDVPCPFANATRCYIMKWQRWRDILQFAHDTNLSLVFGLNDLKGRKPKGKPEKPEPEGLAWNGTNAKSLLTWTKTNIDPSQWPLAFELGNELNDMLTGKQQARDMQALDDIMDDVFGDHPRRPLIVGPDTHSSAEFESSGLKWIEEYAEELSSLPVRNRMLAHTYHMYILGNGEDLKDDSSFLNPTILDRSRTGGEKVRDIVRKTLPASVQVWAGETSSANNGGHSGLTNRFINGFWYLDQLGTLATLGHGSMQRQSLLGTSYGLLNVSNTFSPETDFFIGLAWKTLMGPKVLNATSNSKIVRTYAHCHPSGDGSVVVAVINLGKDTCKLKFNLDATSASGFFLTAPSDDLHSASIQLNGVDLTLDSTITGQPLPDFKDGVEFSKTSFGMVHFQNVNTQSNPCA